MATESLKHISPDRLDRNPENPRLNFRATEMASLMASISRHGIQVPLTVFQDGERFTLIDGERRWRCAIKLNLRTVPVLVRDKPSPLENLLLMFNIHALREQWDYFTIANKLPLVIDLFRQEKGRSPTEAELAEETGLTRGQVRRCRLIMDLPTQYKDLLVVEQELPKNQQKLTEDLFIEMERALKTVQTRVPEAVHDANEARSTLIDKYRAGTIKNITDFRKLRKIATSADSLGADRTKVTEAIETILAPESAVGIMEVFGQEIELKYDAHKALRQGQAFADYLEQVLETATPIADQEFLDTLDRLGELIGRIVERKR